MDLSKNITSIRESRLLTQGEMAVRLDIEQYSYSRLEAKGNKLSIQQAEDIARALGVSLEVLLGFRNEEKLQDLEENLKKSEERVRNLEKQVQDLKVKLDNASLYLIESYSFFTFILNVFFNEELSKLPPNEISLEKINELWIMSVAVAYDDLEKIKRLDLLSPLRLGVSNKDIRDTIQLLRNNLWNVLRTTLPSDDPRLEEKFHWYM